MRLATVTDRGAVCHLCDWGPPVPMPELELRRHLLEAHGRRMVSKEEVRRKGTTTEVYTGVRWPNET